MTNDVIIGGVPFLPLAHHDGRFVRGAGVFAFARREPDQSRTLLHLELADAINRRTGPQHPLWAWALQEGMNELLVHLAGRRAEPGPLTEILAIATEPPMLDRTGSD